MEITNAVKEKLLEMETEFKAQAEIAEKLMKDDPKLSFVSAIVIAGDKIAADRTWNEMAEGKRQYPEAKHLIGSYTRLDWVLRALEAGYTTLDDVLDDLPDLWRGSDPDDTDSRFLNLWFRAWVRNNYVYVRDGKPLPRGKEIIVYRGQDKDAPFGIAWTTDPKIANKFANGAATRQANRGGVIYMGTASRKNILGYLTLRGESEVIINPQDVQVVEGK